MTTQAIAIEQELRGKLLVHAADNRALNQRLMASLASELAMDILPVNDILRSHSITRSEFDALLSKPGFQQLYQEAMLAWGATASASLRIKAKMESMVEQALPALFKEIEKEGLNPSKVELLKAMMKGGGIGEKAVAAGGGGGTQIIINMGAEKPAVTIDAQPLSREADDA